MNRDASKRQRLEELAGEIKKRWPKAFLFPARDGVHGFLGVSPVMFVAERPSTAKEFSGPAKSLLYPFLKEIGAGDGHLTDAIKTPGKVGEPYPEDIADHRRFLDREIEIVRPHLIVAFGQKVYDWLQFLLAGRGIEIRRVRHYSYAGRWPDKRDAWKEELRKALEAMTRTTGLHERPIVDAGATPHPESGPAPLRPSVARNETPARNHIMKTWLKLIGSQEKPITDAPWYGSYTDEHIGFRKANKPSIRTGDHLFLYAPGGSRRIFALAEAVGDPERDPNYKPNEHGSCRWRLSVRYLANLPVTSGILVDDIVCGERDLRLSLRQASHVRLLAGESELAYRKLQEKENA